MGQNDQLEKPLFHEAFVHLIYKIKHEEELLKDILLLGKSLDFSNPLHFISTIRKWGEKNIFMTLARIIHTKNLTIIYF